MSSQTLWLRRPAASGPSASRLPEISRAALFTRPRRWSGVSVSRAPTTTAFKLPNQASDRGHRTEDIGIVSKGEQGQERRLDPEGADHDDR